MGEFDPGGCVQVGKSILLVMGEKTIKLDQMSKKKLLINNFTIQTLTMK